jgi:hypothetical protein
MSALDAKVGYGDSQTRCFDDLSGDSGGHSALVATDGVVIDRPGVSSADVRRLAPDAIVVKMPGYGLCGAVERQRGLSPNDRTAMRNGSDQRLPDIGADGTQRPPRPDLRGARGLCDTRRALRRPYDET